MPRRPRDKDWPKKIKVGNITTYLSGQKARGYFRDAEGRAKNPQFADPMEAENEVRLQAAKMASGQVEPQ
jgi:hypothetical protein